MELNVKHICVNLCCCQLYLYQKAKYLFVLDLDRTDVERISTEKVDSERTEIKQKMYLETTL